jgi:hypothetical protein
MIAGTGGGKLWAMVFYDLEAQDLFVQAIGL